MEAQAVTHGRDAPAGALISSRCDDAWWYVFTKLTNERVGPVLQVRWDRCATQYIEDGWIDGDEVIRWTPHSRAAGASRC